MKEYKTFIYDKDEYKEYRILPTQPDSYLWNEKKKYYKYIMGVDPVESELEKEKREKRELRDKKLKRILKNDPEVIMSSILGV
jgi:hypothetical protein